jgi:hypothetical protein
MLNDADRLLIDSSVAMRFIHAGSDCSRALTDYFGDKLFVVDAVWNEMDELSRSDRIDYGLRVRRFLDEQLKNPKIETHETVKEDVASLLFTWHDEDDHEKKDEGEVATILHAEWARANLQQEHTILIGDGDGLALARAKLFEVALTKDVIYELVCERAMTFEQGERVWMKVDKNKDKKAYRAAIEARCPEAVPPPPEPKPKKKASGKKGKKR